jgi:S-adenosylmethionine:diacylglycerol 3-amino-3-carboxypropyl transferase
MLFEWRILDNQRRFLNAKLDKKRKIGRPKLRWVDEVQADIITLRIKRWICKAHDRQEWARITKEAKVKLKGP